MLNRAIIPLGIVLSVAMLASCGGGGMAPAPAATAPAPTTPSAPPPAPPPAPAQINHVVLVVMENHGFNTIFNNPAAPYINSLATKYALAANYYSNAHQSLKDYFMLTTGVAASDNGSFIGLYADDNLVRELIAGNKTWKSYAMGMPSPGFLDDAYPYLKKHNPFAFLSDVANDTTQRNNLVSLAQFTTDLNAGTLPNFSFVLGDMEHDMHDCPGGAAVTCADADMIAAGDTWLKSAVDPLINNANFQKDGLLIVLFDEAELTDTTNGGGHVMAIFIGPFVKQGFQSTTLYQHQSTLRLFCDLFKLPKCPGAAATAPQMGEFFTPPSPI